MVNTLKFSQFTQANLAADNQIVGLDKLSNGVNTYTSLYNHWTIATRPSPASIGMYGYNTDILSIESYNGTTWVPTGSGGTGTVMQVNTGTGLTGGPITTTGTISFAAIAANSLWANNTGASAVPTVIPLSTFLQSANNLSDLNNTSIARTNLGVAIGSNVEAWSPILDQFSMISLIPDALFSTDGSGSIQLSTTLPPGIVITGYLPLSGGTMTGAINMGANQINNMSNPASPQDAATKAYVDSTASGFVTSVSGTANRIISTGGVAPIIDIDATYVGQTSLTTLGTITTGLWNGTPIDLASYVSGNLAVTHLDSGTSASNTTFWRGDGVWAVPSNGITPSALTKTDDTNVTLTLGGSPTTALLQATSLTLGWTGQLDGSRGGTGVNNGSNTATYAGNLNFANSFVTVGNFAVTQTYTGATNVTFPTTGTLATTAQLPTPSALTEVNDTNVTMTLGGTPATALLQAVSMTLGWTGQLSLTRGGTNASLTASNGAIAYSTASALALSAVGSSGQLFQSAGATTPIWTTATYPSTTTANQLLYSSSNNTITGLSSAANSVLVTNGSSVPSLSSTLPTGLTIPGYLPLTGGTLTGTLNLPDLNINTTTTSTNGVIAQNGSPLIHTFGTDNIFIGSNSGNFTSGSPKNDNIGIGTGTLQNIAASAQNNVAVCTLSLNTLTNGFDNIAIGASALQHLIDGQQNICIGSGAGQNYTGSERNNLLLGNPGVLGESFIGRIGRSGNLTDTYLYGIVHADEGLTVNSHTFSIAGNTTFSGAFTFTGTLTGNTSVTFPTSGTLATTSQLPTPSALTKTDDTNVTLTLGGSPTVALLAATSLTLGWTGQLGLTRGGTNASLTASNGGIVYSTSTALAILSGTSTAGQILRSGATAAPSWSTATYPATATSAGTILRSDGTNWAVSTSTFSDTYTASNLLYSNGSNTVTGLATANNGTLITSGSGVPSISSTLPSAVQNNITAVNSAANTLSIGGSVKTFPSGTVNIPSVSGVTSFTPALAFGGGTTGITYSTQTGFYRTLTYPNGSIETQVWGTITLSNKGSSTGNATLTGLPTTSGANASSTAYLFVPSAITVGAGFIPVLQVNNNATTANIDSTNYNGGGLSGVANTAFANNSSVLFNFTYLNN